MKESIGLTVTINIIVVFLAVAFVFIIGIVAYNRAYKAASLIIKEIEKYEGYNDLAFELHTQNEIDHILFPESLLVILFELAGRNVVFGIEGENPEVDTDTGLCTPLGEPNGIFEVVVVATETETHTGTQENAKIEILVIDNFVTHEERHINEMLTHFETLFQLIFEIIKVGAAERVHERGFEIERTAGSEEDTRLAARLHRTLSNIITEIDAHLDTTSKSSASIARILCMKGEGHQQHQKGKNGKKSFHNFHFYKNLQIIILRGKDTTFFTYGNRMQ